MPDSGTVEGSFVATGGIQYGAGLICNENLTVASVVLDACGTVVVLSKGFPDQGRLTLVLLQTVQSGHNDNTTRSQQGRLLITRLERLRAPGLYSIYRTCKK